MITRQEAIEKAIADATTADSRYEAANMLAMSTRSLAWSAIAALLPEPIAPADANPGNIAWFTSDEVKNDN